MYQMGRHLHAWGLKGKHIDGKYNPRSLAADMGQLHFRHQWDFLISGHVQGRACGGRKSGLRTFPVLPGCGPILYSAHSPRSGANHRQTYPIQSWLWRENLINIITNEMEREEKKGLFSPACWSRRVIGVKATERNRISLVANPRKVRVRASSTPNKESFCVTNEHWLNVYKYLMAAAEILFCI